MTIVNLMYGDYVSEEGEIARQEVDEGVERLATTRVDGLLVTLPLVLVGKLRLGETNVGRLSEDTQ